jgi:hypothetical protein
MLGKNTAKTELRSALWQSTWEKAEVTCWGPSASEGPQKHDLTVFLECNV